MSIVMRGSESIESILSPSSMISSWTTESSMKFGIYIPSIADDQRVPLLIFLSGRRNRISFEFVR